MNTPPPQASEPAAETPEGSVARLVPLDPGLYAFSLASDSGWRDAVVGLALPAVEVCAPPDRTGGIAISDLFGGNGNWLGGKRQALFVEATGAGAAVLVIGHPARDPDTGPLDVEIRRIDGEAAWPRRLLGGPRTPLLPPLMTLRLAARPVLQPGEAASLDVVAHIRGRGDLRFVAAAWVGRLGAGSWIEAFTLISRNPEVADAIEYKGLSAGGAETPWLPCGTPCGTRGRATPLVGFALRQKAGAGRARFDCEYSGYFQSGETAGPARNGAPCRSPRDHDPLEGLQLRITAGPAALTRRSVS